MDVKPMQEISLLPSLVEEFEQKLRASNIGVNTLNELLHQCLAGNFVIIPTGSWSQSQNFQQILQNIKQAFQIPTGVDTNTPKRDEKLNSFFESDDIYSVGKREDSLGYNWKRKTWDASTGWLSNSVVSEDVETIRKTNKTKKPRSAYKFFLQEKQPEFRSKFYSLTEVVQEIGTAWRELPEVEKKYYMDLAAKDTERYRQDRANKDIITNISSLKSEYSSSSCSFTEELTLKKFSTSPLTPKHFINDVSTVNCVTEDDKKDDHVTTIKVNQQDTEPFKKTKQISPIATAENLKLEYIFRPKKLTGNTDILELRPKKKISHQIKTPRPTRSPIKDSGSVSEGEIMERTENQSAQNTGKSNRKTIVPAGSDSEEAEIDTPKLSQKPSYYKKSRLLSGSATSSEEEPPKQRSKNRPMSAYRYFAQEKRDQYKKQYPGLKFEELNKKIAEAWKILDQKGRSYWQEAANNKD